MRAASECVWRVLKEAVGWEVRADLVRAEDERDEALGLGGLRRLVDQDGCEAVARDAVVASARARAADDVGVL